MTHKKITSILIAVLPLNAMAAVSLAEQYATKGSHVIISCLEPKKTADSKDDLAHYMYNEQNQLIWKQKASLRYEYEYDEAGNRIRCATLSWIEAQKQYKQISYETYSYNADGTMAELVKHKTDYAGNAHTDAYRYTEYTDGVATKYENYYDGTLYYVYRVTIDKDAQGHITKLTTEEGDPDVSPVAWAAYPIETIEYTYKANGDIDCEVTTKFNKSTGAAGNTTKYFFTYTDISSDYAPKNLTYTCNNGNIELKWDDVSGSKEYHVVYDQECVTVTSNIFKATVGTGTRMFTVMPVIGNTERNCATPVTIDISDPGKLAITDLSHGEYYQKTVQTESEEMPTRDFYCIPLSWTLPEGHSEIKDIIVYYSSSAYGDDVPVAVGDPTATSYTLNVDPFEMAEWDGEGNPYKGREVPIYVRIEYATGKSDMSNIIYVNPWDALTGINELTIESAGKSTAAYGIGGQQLGTTAKGIVIKNGKKFIVK